MLHDAKYFFGQDVQHTISAYIKCQDVTKVYIHIACVFSCASMGYSICSQIDFAHQSENPSNCDNHNNI